MSKTPENNAAAMTVVDRNKSLPFIPDICTLQSVLVLILLGEMLALVLAIASTGLARFSWMDFGLSSLLIQWIILLSAALLCRLRDWLADQHRIAAGVIAYALVLVVGAFCLLGGQWLMLAEGLRWLVFVEQAVIVALVSGVVLRYLYLQQQLENQRTAEAQARLDALQARIQPHFLFNSLNTVASLIGFDNDQAETMIEDLSELLRASMRKPALVAVSDELTLCRSYMAIEAARFGDRLRYLEEIDPLVDDLVREAKIPNLLLQPLLENAIRHGIQAKKSGGNIVCAVKKDETQLFIEVSNPIPDTEALPQSGNRIALDNIRQRLVTCFGSRAGLTIKKTDEFYCASVFLPLAKTEKDPLCN